MIGMIVLLALKPKRHTNDNNTDTTPPPPQEDVANDQQIPPQLVRTISRSWDGDNDGTRYRRNHHRHWQRDTNNYHDFDSLFLSGLLN
jgi:syntaxin 16